MTRPRLLLTPDQVAEAERLWAAGTSVDAVCRAIGVNRDVWVERRRPGDQLAHLGRRRPGVRRGARRQTLDPTPSEIAERSAAIRATWSPVEQLNRRAGPGQPVDLAPPERYGREAYARRPMAPRQQRKW